jgi:hypothetical protein
MRTLPHWDLLPLLGGTLAYYFGLGWLKRARWDANRGDDGQAARPAPRPSYATLPTEDDWCPAHDTYFDGANGGECPSCRDEWERTRAMTGEDQRARDDWEGRQEEAARAQWPTQAEIDHYEETRGDRADGWYLDLVRQAEQGRDPDDGFREGDGQ